MVRMWSSASLSQECITVFVAGLHLEGGADEGRLVTGGGPLRSAASEDLVRAAGRCWGATPVVCALPEPLLAYPFSCARIFSSKLVRSSGLTLPTPLGPPRSRQRGLSKLRHLPCGGMGAVASRVVQLQRQEGQRCTPLAARAESCAPSGS